MFSAPRIKFREKSVLDISQGESSGTLNRTVWCLSMPARAADMVEAPSPNKSYTNTKRIPDKTKPTNRAKGRQCEVTTYLKPLAGPWMSEPTREGVNPLKQKQMQ